MVNSATAAMKPSVTDRMPIRNHPPFGPLAPTARRAGGELLDKPVPVLGGAAVD